MFKVGRGVKQKFKEGPKFSKANGLNKNIHFYNFKGGRGPFQSPPPPQFRLWESYVCFSSPYYFFHSIDFITILIA